MCGGRNIRTKKGKSNMLCIDMLQHLIILILPRIWHCGDGVYCLLAPDNIIDSWTIIAARLFTKSP